MNQRIPNLERHAARPPARAAVGRAGSSSALCREPDRNPLETLLRATDPRAWAGWGENRPLIEELGALREVLERVVAAERGISEADAATLEVLIARAAHPRRGDSAADRRAQRAVGGAAQAVAMLTGASAVVG